MYLMVRVEAALLPGLTRQFLPEVFPQRIQINVLNLTVEQMVMTPLGGPFGLSDPDPVGGFITGSLESIFLNKGFKQINVMIIDFEPILRDSPGIERQDF